MVRYSSAKAEIETHIRLGRISVMRLVMVFRTELTVIAISTSVKSPVVTTRVHADV